MQTILFSMQIIIAIAIIVFVLLQRSEGGALGIGGGGPGNFMSGRGTANLLTRITAILGVCFFLTSLGLALLAQSEQRGSIIQPQPGAEDSAPVLPPLSPEGR